MIRFFACALLALCPPRVTAAEYLAVRDAAWREVCTISRYDCDGLAPPMVRITKYVPLAGSEGIHMGGRTVWLSPKLTGQDLYLVVVHEMVHYLQQYADDNGVPFTSAFERCVYEEEAYEVSDIVARRLGAPPDIWRLRYYGCP